MQKLKTQSVVSYLLCLSNIVLSAPVWANISTLEPNLTAPHPVFDWVTFRNGPQNRAVSHVSVKEALKKFKENRQVKGFDTKRLIWGTPVIDKTGNIYVGAADKVFYSISPEGQLRWSYTLFDIADSLIDSAAALHPTRDIVIVPGGDGFLHALNRDTGEQVWVFKAYHSDNQQKGQIVNSFEGNVQIGPTGLIYAGSDNGYLYAVDVNGREAWSFKTGMMIWSSPAIDLQNQWMAFGSLDGNLYLVDPKTGTELDRMKSDGDVKSSPTTDGENIYFGTSNGSLVSAAVTLTPKGYKLKENWKFQTRGEIYSSPAIKDQKVVFGSLDGRLYCLNSKGEHQWTYTAYSRISSSPLITQDNVVFFGAKNGKMYAIDYNTGQRIWSYKTSTDLAKTNLDSSPSLGENATIHVGSYNGIIYSIPYEFCFTNPEDSRCEFGGTSDNPDGDASTRNSATLKMVSSPEVEISNTIQLKLIAYKDGVYQDHAAIDASSINLKVEISPEVEIDAQVSSDGKFLNIIPRGFFKPDTHYQVNVKGLYYQQTQSWLWDRFKYFGRERFAGQTSFTTHSAKTTEIDFAGSNDAPTWGLRSLYLYQPEALDTYTPAALDGQAFLATGFSFAKQETGERKFIMLVLPALPKSDGYLLMPEPSKAFTLDSVYENGNIKGKGSFHLAAMGGDIPFKDFTFSMTLNPESGSLQGEFNAISSCLSIKGNGSSYSFPSMMVNQVCDPMLRIIGLGSFDGQRIGTRSRIMNPILGKLVEVTQSPNRKAKMTVQIHSRMEASETPSAHLLTLVQYRPDNQKVLKSTTLVINPEDIGADGQVSKTFRLKRDWKPGSMKFDIQLFLDTQPLKMHVESESLSCMDQEERSNEELCSETPVQGDDEEDLELAQNLEN